MSHTPPNQKRTRRPDLQRISAYLVANDPGAAYLAKEGL